MLIKSKVPQNHYYVLINTTKHINLQLQFSMVDSTKGSAVVCTCLSMNIAQVRGHIKI